MPVIDRIFNNGKIINYRPDTNITKDMFNFGSINVVDQLNIYNFEQNNPNDFILKETIINQNTGPPDIFNSNNIIVQKNLNISSISTNITNVFNNEGNTLVRNNLYLEDRFIASNYYIEDDLICKKNLVVKNSNRFSDFTFDMNIKKSLQVLQDFIVENNINTKKDITINNNLNSTIITYNNVTINNELKIFNNFNSSANLNINKIYLDKSFNSENHIIVDDSIIIKNNSLYLPDISIHNNIDGSLRFNSDTNNIEAYISNNWNILNELQNLENTSRVKHHEYFKPFIGSNIDFIQNNNITFTINSNSQNVIINKKNVNINDLYINDDLNINNDFNVTKNINIINNCTVKNNLYITNNQLLVVSSNNTSVSKPENGALRYNNENNLYEFYNNKWRPLQHITNSNNVSNIELYPNFNPNLDYDTILFNLNKSVLLNINESLCNFNIENIILNKNLNISHDLIINNNINTDELNINTNRIYEKNGRLFNSAANITDNKIGYQEIFVDNLINLDLHKFTFYSSNITNNFEKCNTINPIILSNHSIINYTPFLSYYKIYNDVTITKYIVYFNQIINDSDVSFDFTLNTNTYSFTNINNYYYIGNIDQLINANSNFQIDIKCNKIIYNLQLVIVFYGTYKNTKGILKTPHSSNIIDTNNIFEKENRIIQGNTLINNNLNIINNNNLNLSYLHVNNTIGIGTTLIDNNNTDFIIKNKNNTVLVHKNNKVGINTDTPNYKLDINCDNLNIDNNFNVSNSLTINKNLNNVSNLNISNTLITNNINKNNFILKDNITFTTNINSNYNLNVSNNVNVNNLTIYPNLIFTQNHYNSNIVFNNNILKFNINSIIYNSNYFPVFNDNNIYLQDNNNINFKSNSKNLLNISSKLFSTNNHNLDESNIFSISSNFNINKNEINIKSPHFIVNNIDLLDRLNSIERYYYSPYNINISKINNNNAFNITYNRPGFYYNLNNPITHINKKIDYIAFQFCLGNTNSHINPNWNNNSFIYYENIENINFTKNTMHYSTDLNIDKINKNNYINSNIEYDFNNTVNTFNLNIGTQKTQLIYNTTDSCIFSDYLNTNQNITLRMYPIYNIREEYLYYSNPINFTL